MGWQLWRCFCPRNHTGSSQDGRDGGQQSQGQDGVDDGDQQSQSVHAPKAYTGRVARPSLSVETDHVQLHASKGRLVTLPLPVPVTPRTALQALQHLPDPHLAAVILKVDKPRPWGESGGAIMSTQQAWDAGPHSMQQAEAGHAATHVVLADNGPKCRLVPVWCNTPAAAQYQLMHARDYQRVLKRLAARDPLLVYVLEKALRQLQPGSAGSSSVHVTADSTCEQPTLLGLRLTACWWQEDPAAGSGGGSSLYDKAIIVQHGVPMASAEVVPRVLRDYVFLNLIPCIVTVVTFTGRVLYQNASSLAYMGDFSLEPAAQATAAAGLSDARSSAFSSKPSVCSRPGQLSMLGLPGSRGHGWPAGVASSQNSCVDCGVWPSPSSQSAPMPSVDLIQAATQSHLPDDKNLLKQLFNMDHRAMEDALEVLSSNSQWSGVIQVPHNLKRYLRAQRRAQALVHHSHTLHAGSSPPSAQQHFSSLMHTQQYVHSHAAAGPARDTQEWDSWQHSSRPSGAVAMHSNPLYMAAGPGSGSGSQGHKHTGSPAGPSSMQSAAFGSVMQLSGVVQASSSVAGSSSQRLHDLHTPAMHTTTHGQAQGQPGQGTWFAHGSHMVPSTHSPGEGLAGRASSPPGSPTATSAVHFSADSYEFEAGAAARPRSLTGTSNRWLQLGLEPVQEVDDLEEEVDLDLAGDDDFPPGGPPLRSPLSQHTTTSAQQHFDAMGSAWTGHSSGSHLQGGLAASRSHAGTASGPVTSASQDANEWAAAPFERPGRPPYASRLSFHDSVVGSRMSGTFCAVMGGGGAARGEAAPSLERSFTLPKSVTAVLDVIERKRISNLDALQQASSSTLPGCSSPAAPGTSRVASLISPLSGSAQQLLAAPGSGDDMATAPAESSDARGSWVSHFGSRSSAAFKGSQSGRLKQVAGGMQERGSDPFQELKPGGAPRVPVTPGQPSKLHTTDSGVPGRLSVAGRAYDDLGSGPLIVRGSDAMDVEPATPTSTPRAAAAAHAGQHAHGTESPGEASMAQQDVPFVHAPLTPHVAAQPPCWHEVTALPMMDPVLDQRVLLITQTDVSKRMDVERKLAELTGAQMSMLEQMFPRHVIEHMLSEPGLLATDVGRLANDHNMVSVLFADVVGFTTMSKEISASAVMMFLNTLYGEFDSILEEYGLYQLDTMGDCYIVVGGLVERDETGFQALQNTRTTEEAAQDAWDIMQFAKAMLLRASQVCMPHNGQPVRLRVGIHSGRLVSGMLGTRLPKFTLFGDTMNTASRMESTAVPGCIQVSEDTYTLLRAFHGLPADSPSQAGDGSSPLDALDDQGCWTATGGVEVKGKGVMNTWLFTPQLAPMPPIPGDGADVAHSPTTVSETGEHSCAVPALRAVTTSLNGTSSTSVATGNPRRSVAFSAAAASLATVVSEQLHEELGDDAPSGGGGGAAGSAGARRRKASLHAYAWEGWRALERGAACKAGGAPAATMQTCPAERASPPSHTRAQYRRASTAWTVAQLASALESSSAVSSQRPTGEQATACSLRVMASTLHAQAGDEQGIAHGPHYTRSSRPSVDRVSAGTTADGQSAVLLAHTRASNAARHSGSLDGHSTATSHRRRSILHAYPSSQAESLQSSSSRHVRMSATGLHSANGQRRSTDDAGFGVTGPAIGLITPTQGAPMYLEGPAPSGVLADGRARRASALLPFQRIAASFLLESMDADRGEPAVSARHDAPAPVTQPGSSVPNVAAAAGVGAASPTAGTAAAASSQLWHSGRGSGGCSPTLPSVAAASLHARAHGGVHPARRRPSAAEHTGSAMLYGDAASKLSVVPRTPSMGLLQGGRGAGEVPAAGTSPVWLRPRLAARAGSPQVDTSTSPNARSPMFPLQRTDTWQTDGDGPVGTPPDSGSPHVTPTYTHTADEASSLRAGFHSPEHLQLGVVRGGAASRSRTSTGVLAGQPRRRRNSSLLLLTQLGAALNHIGGDATSPEAMCRWPAGGPEAGLPAAAGSAQSP